MKPTGYEIVLAAKSAARDLADEQYDMTSRGYGRKNPKAAAIEKAEADAIEQYPIAVQYLYNEGRRTQAQFNWMAAWEKAKLSGASDEVAVIAANKTKDPWYAH